MNRFIVSCFSYKFLYKYSTYFGSKQVLFRFVWKTAVFRTQARNDETLNQVQGDGNIIRHAGPLLNVMPGPDPASRRDRDNTFDYQSETGRTEQPK